MLLLHISDVPYGNENGRGISRCDSLTLNKERIMETSLNYLKLRKYFQASLVMVILALMWGCGSGGGSTAPVVVSKNAISISPSSSSEYVVRGDNMEGVGGIDLTISYDSTTMSSPTVTQGGLISGALMAPNTATPGTIRIAVISTKAISGSGQIATISFAAVTGPAKVSITSVSMIDTSGVTIPLT